MRTLKQLLRRFYYGRIKGDEKAVACFDYLDAGGEALRLDYPLNECSLVIDVGGYIGDFAAEISNIFHCRIDVFEPVHRHAEIIRDRFVSNPQIQLIEAGLGALESEQLIGCDGAASTLFIDHNDAGRQEQIRIVSAIDYIRSSGYSDIDLIKVNIEGGEYELLEALLDCPDIISGIKYLQIQFHDFVPAAREKRLDIQNRLTKTHKPMWDFPFIWESWERLEQ